MDSQLASVLTGGSLDVQNGSRCAEGPGPVREVSVDLKEKTSVTTGAGNLQPCPVRAAMTTVAQDAPPVNGNMPEVGGSSQPASQETNKIGGFRRPITVKTGVPVLRSQPIRIKIVVPPRCKRPIANSAIRLTKDYVCSRFRQPVLLSCAAVVRSETSAVEKEAGLREVSPGKTEEPEVQPVQGSEVEGGDTTCSRSDNILPADVSQTAPLTNTNLDESASQRETDEDANERDAAERVPLVSEETNSRRCETFDEEQLEPLDLSLPKKKEGRARFLDDSGCETSLIMEVDEYEGDGDRDIVEEDDVPEEDRTDALEDSLLSPSFFSTSVFTSLPSLERDTEHLLLIDDQGIPYTLSPDGLKVPQVDGSTPRDAPSDGPRPAEVEEQEASQLADLSLSQSSDDALEAPSDARPTQAPDSSSLALDQTKAPEVVAGLMRPLSESSKDTKAGQEATAVLSPPTGVSAPSQPVHILTNPPANAPILLLSPSSSSPRLSAAPVGLSLPLSVTQTAPGASTQMFLLLSSVPSSTGDTSSTSTPIAVLDPATGHFSQIAAAPALPLSSPQVSALGPPLPMLSHPVIRLSAGDPPLVLSGVDTGNPGSALTSLPVPLKAPAPQNDHKQTTSSVSHTGSEAIRADEVSGENDKPSTFAESSPRPQSADFSHDRLTSQPSSEAQSPASESKFDPGDLRPEHLPLDDHLYFSNMAAPPSPPTGPILPSCKLDPLGALDPLSPASSPNASGPRRVLYCQLCPRVFFYLSDLERHAITHSQKKPHVCQQCGKAFKRSSHLQRHKHIHTGQRNFVCPICAKRFREAGELQRHQRVHTGEKPYQCQLCHTRFAERNTLRRHTKRKHPYHQVAMEMLNERRDRAGGGGGGISGVQEEEESAEWYSSTVSHLDNSESEMET